MMSDRKLTHQALLRHLPHQKLDLNSGQFSEATVSPVSRRHGGYFPFSTDAPGLQHDWPLGNATARAAVFAAHERQHRALLHFLGTDAQLRSWQPALVAEVGSFGLAADEFTESGHWPPQLYLREARRMVGEFGMQRRSLPCRRPTCPPARPPTRTPVCLLVCLLACLPAWLLAWLLPCLLAYRGSRKGLVKRIPKRVTDR